MEKEKLRVKALKMYAELMAKNYLKMLGLINCQNVELKI